MAVYDVSRAKNATLTIATVDTVTLTVNKPWIQIWNLASSGSLWFTAGVDPVDPTVAGDDTICVSAGGVVSVQWPSTLSSNVAVVKLVSDVAAGYDCRGS
jgi:hypothetical protein